ncbi:putative signal transduction protein [Escherichia coli]|nr:putative signal transduction protein [Escherichia coli]
MNDENFFKKAAAHGEEPPLTPQNEHQRSGLRFARRVRLPRAVGLAGMFLTDCFNAGFAPAAGLVVAGVGRLGVRLAAFSLADSEQGRRSA